MLPMGVQSIQVTPLRVTKPDEHNPFSSTPVTTSPFSLALPIMFFCSAAVPTSWESLHRSAAVASTRPVTASSVIASQSIRFIL